MYQDQKVNIFQPSGFNVRARRSRGQKTDENEMTVFDSGTNKVIIIRKEKLYYNKG